MQARRQREHWWVLPLALLTRTRRRCQRWNAPRVLSVSRYAEPLPTVTGGREAVSRRWCRLRRERVEESTEKVAALAQSRLRWPVFPPLNSNGDTRAPRQANSPASWAMNHGLRCTHRVDVLGAIHSCPSPRLLAHLRPSSGARIQFSADWRNNWISIWNNKGLLHCQFLKSIIKRRTLTKGKTLSAQKIHVVHAQVQ